MRRGFDFILRIKTYDENNNLVTNYNGLEFEFIVEDIVKPQTVYYRQFLTVNVDTLILHITANETYQIPGLNVFGNDNVNEYTELSKIKIPHNIYNITVSNNETTEMFSYGAFITYKGILDDGLVRA